MIFEALVAAAPVLALGSHMLSQNLYALPPEMRDIPANMAPRLQVNP